MTSNIKIRNEELTKYLADSTTDFIANVTIDTVTGEVTATKKNGESFLAGKLNLSIENAITAGEGGDSTANSTLTVNAGSNTKVDLVVPYFVVDEKGRITSAYNRNVRIAVVSYTNYASYANYSNYSDYSNYADYSNYKDYTNYHDYASYSNYYDYDSYSQFNC